jgi:hypothetical protein
MKKLIQFSLIISILFISSCVEDNFERKGDFSVSISILNVDNGGRISDASQPKSILISIKDQEGEFVYNKSKLPLYKFGDEYITENLQFDLGDYSVEEFLVLDSLDSVIYLTPIEGSEFAEFVRNPLPYSFSIGENGLTEVELEVIASDLGAVSQYGYASFSFKTVEVLIIQPDSIKGKDAIFSKIVPDKNFGNIEDMHLYAWTQGGILNVNRIAIDFDLNDIPDNVQIDSAFLQLSFNSSSGYMHGLGLSGHHGENSFLVKKILEPWHEEGITWGTQPETSTDNMVIVPDSDVLDQNYRINVSGIINDLHQNPDMGFGFMIMHQFEEAYKATFLASSDHPDKEKRPKLVVHYHSLITD